MIRESISNFTQIQQSEYKSKNIASNYESSGSKLNRNSIYNSVQYSESKRYSRRSN